MERTHNQFSLFLAFIFSCLLSLQLHAEDITADTTLFVGDYTYSDHLVVKNGATLTIENGAILRFAASKYLMVEAGGKLQVQGQEGNPVIFTSDTLQSGAWQGLILKGSRDDATEIVIDHAIIEYADKALYTNQSRFKATVTNTTVRHNNYGVYVSASWQSAPNHPYIHFTDGALHDNAIYNYYSENFNGSTITRIDATGNWWGTDDIALIADSIHDISDRSLRPSIDFGGFLTAIDGPAYPGTHVMGYITEDTIWNMTDGEMLGDVTVASGVTLTIQAGSQIHAHDNTKLTVASGGQLHITGTETSPVLFTHRNAAPGSWQGFVFQGARSNSNEITIDHAIIEYADKALYTTQSKVKATVTHTTVRHNNYGVYVNAAWQSAPNHPYITFQNGALHDNAVYNYYTENFNGSVITRIDASGNWWGSSDVGEIGATIYDINDRSLKPSIDFSGYLTSLNGPAQAGTHVMGYLAEDTVWNMADGVLINPVTVPNGVTLTIAAGTRITAMPNTQIKIASGGKLNVAGSSASPVVFTSDTPTIGSWKGFIFEGSRSDASELVINNAIIEYADKALYTNRSRVKVTATNTTVRYNNYGVYVDAAWQSASNHPYITFKDGALHDNAQYNYYSQNFNGSAITSIDASGNWWGSADVTEIGNSIHDINDRSLRPSINFAGFLTALNGPAYPGTHVMGHITQNATWNMTDGVMIGKVTVANGVTLNVAAGTRISAMSNTSLTVAAGGKLHVAGSASSPVIFTSETPTAGSWQGIVFQGSRNSADELTIDHAIIEYADKALYTTQSRVKATVTHTTVRHNNYGVYVNAVYQSASNHPYITFKDGALHDNAVYNYYTENFNGSTITSIDANGNWWGSTDINQINNSIHDVNDRSLRPFINFAGFLTALDGSAYPGTHLMGYITEDTLWNVSDGVVINNITIPANISLQIAAGSHITFMPGTRIQANYGGTLLVTGTPGAPVTLTSSNSTPSAGDWKGIEIANGSTLAMNNAVVEYAENGVSFIGSRATGLITNSEIRHNNTGIFVDGVYQSYANHPTPVVNHSQLYGNQNYQYYTQNFSSGSSRTLNAKGNWWGTTDTTVIAQSIKDNVDHGSLPLVDTALQSNSADNFPSLSLLGSNLAYGTISTEFTVALSNGSVISSSDWQQLNGTPVTLSAGSNPASVTFSAPDVASEETLTFAVTAQDENGIYSYTTVDIQLRPFAMFNSPPEVPDSVQEIFTGGSIIDIVMTASDTDPLTYQWTQTFGSPITLADSNSDTLSFTAPAITEDQILRFHLVVSDGTYNIEREVVIGLTRPEDNAGTYYYHNDHLGTPQVLTDQSQNIVWQASYTPFGEAVITTEQVENNIRFPGQYYDQESGLHYNYFRDYDPESGRYIQSDRLGLFDGQNTYGYAHQNPISKYDPTGEFVPQLLGFFVSAGLEYLTNPCASASDILIAGGMGALGGGLLAKAFKKIPGKEWSHWIPDRYVRPMSKSGKSKNKYYKPLVDKYLNKFVNSRFNGNYVSKETHALTDPFRYKFMNRAWKKANPMHHKYVQQAMRVPGWIPGAPLVAAPLTNLAGDGN